MKKQRLIKVALISLILFLSWTTYHYWSLYNEQHEDSKYHYFLEVHNLASSFDKLSESFLHYEEPHELIKMDFVNPYTHMSRVNESSRGRPISYEFENTLNKVYEKLEEGISQEEAVLMNEKFNEVADIYYSFTDTDLSLMLTEDSRKRIEETSNQALAVLNELLIELEKN